MDRNSRGRTVDHVRQESPRIRIGNCFTVMIRTEHTFNVSGFSYDPETGSIFLNGLSVAGYSDRYLRISRFGVRVAAHRFAWRLNTGAWPESEIDHINGDRLDNRWANLRQCSHSDNNCNRSKQARKHRGWRGACLNPKTHSWMVKVKRGTTLVHGRASTSLSAIIASRLIRRLLHGQFSIESRPITTNNESQVR